MKSRKYIVVLGVISLSLASVLNMYAQNADTVDMKSPISYGLAIDNASVSTIKGSELTSHPSSNLSNALGGRLVGVQSNQYGAEPTNDYSGIRIRGFRTLGDRVSDPLVLVDGFQADYTNLDANEIETVQILKDAASTAIYGQRGANGVILITTKRGKEGDFSIKFDAQYGLQKLIGIPSFLSSYDYANLYNEALYNDGEAAQYDYDDLSAYIDQTGNNVYTHPNVDFMDEFLNNTAPTQKYSMQMSGGSKKVRYYVLLGYLNQSGFYKYAVKKNKYSTNAEYSRFNMRSNVDIDVTDDLLASINVAGQMAQNRAPYSGNQNIWSTLTTTPPNLYPVFVPSGGLGGTSTNFNNPIGLMSNSGYRDELSRDLQVSANLRYDMSWLTEGLDIFANYAYSSFNSYGYQQKQEYAVYVVNELGGELTEAKHGEDKNLTNGTDLSNYMGSNSTLSGGINYAKSIGIHSIKASLISEMSQSIIPLELPYTNINHSIVANYDYNSLFSVGGSLTYSGSDSYAAGNRWGWFYSLSAGLNIHNMDFMRSVEFIDKLKLRGSIGSTGNNMNPSGQDRYLFQSDYNHGYGYRLGAGSFWNGTIVEQRPANHSYTWEKAQLVNVGLELEMFKSLYAEFDFYTENRRDILISAGNIIPEIIGVTPPMLNMGKVNAYGGEVLIGYNRNINDFQINVELMGSFFRSTIVENGELSILSENQKGIGKKPYAAWGYKDNGFFYDENDVANSLVQNFGAYGAGDVKYADLNGDSVIDNNDITTIGYNYIPELFTGLNIELKYKGFDISTNIVGAFNRSIWRPSVFGNNIANGGKFAEESLERWANYTNPNTGELIDTRDQATLPKLSMLNSENNNQGSTINCIDADYIRIRSIEFGYSLPAELLSKARIEKMRVFVNAYNPMLLYNQTPYEFPEFPEAVNSYGQSSIYSLGVSLTL